LVSNDLLEQVDVALAVRRHRAIAVAAHADRHDILARGPAVPHSLDAFAPEIAQCRIVEPVVPRSFAVPLPLLLRARHRFVV